MDYPFPYPTRYPLRHPAPHPLTVVDVIASYYEAATLDTPIVAGTSSVRVTGEILLPSGASFTTSHHLFGFADGGADGVIITGASGGGLQLLVNGVQQAVTGTSLLNDQEWHTFDVEYDSGTGNSYIKVDGNTEDTGIGGPAINVAAVATVGGRSYSKYGSACPDVYLYDINIYIADALVARYKDGGYSGVDSSGNGNDATLGAGTITKVYR